MRCNARCEAVSGVVNNYYLFNNYQRLLDMG